MRVYGFAGGVPFYLVEMGTPFLDWINGGLRRVDTVIRDEVDFLLRYEFREVSTYREVLLAIALGKNTLDEIRDFAGVGGEVSSYLKKLERVGLVRREVPALEGARSKKGRYTTSDIFVRSWSTFVYPNLSLIEQGRYSIGEGEYYRYLGTVFRQVCREYVRDRYGGGGRGEVLAQGHRGGHTGKEGGRGV